MDISKSELIEDCQKLLTGKKDAILAELSQIREAATSETKSSMGDKYETSREMMRQEENKLMTQIGIIEDQMMALSRLNAEKVSQVVEAGSIVRTESSTLFISISLGKIDSNKNILFAISPTAPLAQKMLGKKAGEIVQYNGQSHTIKSVQ